MAPVQETKDSKDIKSYADGWMTERKNTEIPAFLKATYIVVALGCAIYLVVFMNGEINHSTRGVLVQQFNKVTGTANGFMYLVAAMIVIFAIITVKFAFSKSHED
jgi:hypothetical protein